MTTGPADGLSSRFTGPVDRRGFPAYYTDSSGVSLRICEDGTFACLATTTAALANRVDGEAFYWQAAATLPTSRGTLDVEIALEAAFAERNVPSVFTRIRVRGHLSRAGSYVLNHPYGSLRINAASASEQRNVNTTIDVDCPLGPGPCGGRIDNFLRSTSLGVGYLGLAVPGRVTGGSVRNSLSLRTSSGRTLGSTRQFAIVGKLATGPANVITTPRVSFGNTARPRTRTLLVHSAGSAALTFGAIRMSGTRQVTVARTGCAARRSLAPGGNCRVTLHFRPGAARVVRGALLLSDNTRVGTHRIPVSASTSGVVSAVNGEGFGTHRVGTSSRTHRILVRNTGLRAMRISGVSVAGTGARSFHRTAGGDRCVAGTRVAAHTSCSVYVRFAPTSRGLKLARLNVRASALNSPQSVLLRGRGVR
ncbi:MAG: choice-of-anchor D domain-containing protein [Nocardioidaceae bacterium]|nr:choice-of-anchor D domain-containing protein [Nocardioidaceae bacterium]NUS50012.1 choice-of-anchor D domain-containing protein [Nocardioidaceae bacterium]